MPLSWLHRFSKRKSRPDSRTGRKPFGGNRCVPNLEALDDRIVPSTFHVTTLADEGAGSLRDAIAQANAHAGADIVVFDERLTGTVALTGGELDITDDLRINGPGADRLTVSGNVSRVFTVEAGQDVRISGLTIAGGRAGGFGGGILNLGALTVSGVVFSDNLSDSGGGLANMNGGTLTVRDSTFVGNVARVSGGGLINFGAAAEVRDSTFADNSAVSDGGGLANENRATVTVRDSTFTGNVAQFGGGLINFAGATATVIDSTFAGNHAGSGGGLFNLEGSTATVRGSTFTENTAGGNGGGVLNSGRLTVSDSTFAVNTAGQQGGGIDNLGTAAVRGSTFVGNSAGSGNGGLNNEPGGLLTQSDNQFINDLPPDIFP
jgi:hypothetical protein